MLKPMMRKVALGVPAVALTAAIGSKVDWNDALPMIENIVLK